MATAGGFCTSCGAPLTAGTRFCTSCGAQSAAPPTVNVPLAQSPASASPPPAAPPPPWTSAAQAGPAAIPVPPKKGGHTLRNILLGALVFVVGVIGLALFATSGPADAVERHLSLLAKGDVTTAYAETDPMFKQGVSQAQFATLVQRYPILTKSSASWDSRSTEGDQGLVTGTLTAPDGSRAKVEYHVLKGSDGTWRIIGFGVTPTQ
ncbi:MAG: DUF4864 domain-containing protein [Chloroflexi bacterium]|nr:DUF4864 domain-containing protein [Chloroflexota bacterium]MDE3113858.1 DUF4864 domain-containing protein [Chloroflexota bacterium]